MADTHPTLDGNYFLSKENPAATSDQRYLEDLALKLFERPDVKAARRSARAAWAMVTEFNLPAQQWAMFDEQMIDYCFRGTIVATNSDAQYPRVMRIYMPRGNWFGREVPGSKWGGENPDNAYRLMPVEQGASYLIHGRRETRTEASTYVTYQIVGNTTTSHTVASLEQRDIDISPDGTYAITLGPDAAGGRRNHLQLPRDAKYVFVRDSMGDWLSQTPDRLRIERTSPTTRDPLNEDDLAARVIHSIIWDTHYAYFASRIFLNKTNGMPDPINPAAVGGLVTQINSPGNFHQMRAKR